MSAAGSDDETPIFVLDELTLRSGMLERFLEAMESRYRPGAEARGQRLIHTWVSPPTQSEGVEQSVLLVWQLDGVPGFWRMRSQNAQPEIEAWWRECEVYASSRTRRFAASPGDLAPFEALGRAHA